MHSLHIKVCLCSHDEDIHVAYGRFLCAGDNIVDLRLTLSLHWLRPSFRSQQFTTVQAPRRPFGQDSSFLVWIGYSYSPKDNLYQRSFSWVGKSGSPTSPRAEGFLKREHHLTQDGEVS